MDTLPLHALNCKTSYIMLPVGRNNYALVDFADADLANFTWSNGSGGYALRHVKSKALLMHRVIIERVLNRPIRKKYHIDHINGNRLDNRRENLREVTIQQNVVNRKCKSNAQGSQYKGVMPKGMKWVSCIGYQGKNLHIGVYDDEQSAAKAYDAAALLLYGEYAKTNGILDSVPPDFVLRSVNSPLISTNTTGYRGVYKMGKRWRVQIEIDGRPTALGGFASLEEAARAYDKAAIARSRQDAITNFPLSDYEETI